MPESIEMLPAEVISIDNKNLDVDDEDGGNDANQSFKSDQRAKQNLNHQNVSRKNLADELQLGPKIFSIILPFIFVGCPFNHCFPKSFNPFVNSIGMKVIIFSLHQERREKNDRSINWEFLILFVFFSVSIFRSYGIRSFF